VAAFTSEKQKPFRPAQMIADARGSGKKPSSLFEGKEAGRVSALIAAPGRDA
jgi:hypothetical protein